MNEIMGQENETQESKDGVKLARTHGVDIEDVARGGEEGFNGGALIVEFKPADWSAGKLVYNSAYSARPAAARIRRATDGRCLRGKFDPCTASATGSQW
jgi:hypothetical protein